jgi:hypothetical protein
MYETICNSTNVYPKTFQISFLKIKWNQLRQEQLFTINK